MLKVVHKSAFSMCIFALLFSIFLTSSASATDVDYNVSVAPALTLTIPSNPIIINLDPSSKTFDSKDLTVSVGTNNKTGYTLTLSTPNDSTNLNRDTTSDGISAVMPTLDPGTYTQSSFTADKWGYKINSNTSIPSTITSGYVPFQSGNTLMESDTAVNHDEAELSLAAKIDYLQASGSYSTTLNFNIVAHPVLDYMQNFTPAMCKTLASDGDYTVMDRRDMNTYTVRWINGNCWMTQNLTYIGNGTIDGSGNISGTMALDPTTSNVNTATSFEYGDLKSGDTYDVPRIHVGVDDHGDPTVWYNYAAISAKSITGSSNTTTTTQSVCPAGWRLATTTEQQSIFSYKNEFNVVTGGVWTSGGLVDLTVTGTWWASTAYNATQRNVLYYNTSTLSNIDRDRSYGRYARCILRNTMQNFTNQEATAMTTNETKNLEDERDGQMYTVAKLGDGNVWMTKNLAIGCNGATIVGASFTPTDSNVASNWSITSSDSFAQGTNYNNPRMACSATYGGHYNYAAASAGTVVGSSDTHETEYSICPSGWRLPTYAEALGILGYKANYLPVSGGYYNDSGVLTSTGYGYWWTSTSYSATEREVLRYNGTNLDQTYHNTTRNKGVYVRCIKDDPRTIANISTMQEISPQIVAKMSDGDTTTLEDSRDGQEYTVAKINGNLWMTRNLAIGCNGSGSNYGDTITSKTLTSTDSNITAASWSTPTNNLTVIGNTLNDPAMMCSTTYGAWYNYVAATAGTITGSSNSTNATVDICPAGWRLATYTEQSGITSSVSLFSPVAGGYYYAKNNSDTNKGWYWASTANGATGRYRIVWDGSTLVANSANYREDGFYVRCIAR